MYVCSKEAACSFPSCLDSQNNQTEIVLINSLLGPVVLASYWITLTS